MKANPISARPTDVLICSIRAVAQYGTITAAAEQLCISRHTVDSHLDRLRAISGLRHLPQLIGWAAVHGWLAGGEESGAVSQNTPDVA
jgi:hypothetical protein